MKNQSNAFLSSTGLGNEKNRMRLFIAKDYFKFSSAHMTIFPDGKKEALHGHNYRIELAIEVSPDLDEETWIEFSEIKNPILKICELFDEKVLLPNDSSLLEWGKCTKEELEFRLCGKRYVLPADEVCLIDVSNITVESLAAEISKRLRKGFEEQQPNPLKRILSLETLVKENEGQGASFLWQNPQTL